MKKILLCSCVLLASFVVFAKDYNDAKEEMDEGYLNDLVIFEEKLMENKDAVNALIYKMHHFTPIKIDKQEISAEGFFVPVVVVDSDTIEIRIGINADKEKLKLDIWDPNGHHFSSDELGEYVTYTNNPAIDENDGSQFYQITAPTKGPWGLWIINEDKTKSIDCEYYAVAKSDIIFNSKISKNKVLSDEKIDFLVTLKKKDAPILDAKVNLIIQERNDRREEALFDDGQHNDGQANDGIYGNSLSISKKGRYSVVFNAEGEAEFGDTFFRQSIREYLYVE